MVLHVGDLGSEEGQVAGCCESGNELPSFIKCGEFIN